MKIDYLDSTGTLRKFKSYLDKIIYQCTLRKISFHFKKNGKNISYVEFGPGTGNKYKWFNEYFGVVREAHFFDIDSNILRHLQLLNKKLTPSSLHLLSTRDTEDFSVIYISLESRFDVAISSHVIEQTVDPRNHLRALKFLLKDGGILYIATPNLASKNAQNKGKLWRGYLDESHISLLEHKQLESLLVDNGFEILYSGTSTCWSSFKSVSCSLFTTEWSFNRDCLGDATNIVARKKSTTPI